MKFFIPVFLFLYAANCFGQEGNEMIPPDPDTYYFVTISGPSTAVIGSTKTYNVTWTPSQPWSMGDWRWFTSDGNIISQTQSTCNVQWTGVPQALTSARIEYEFETFDNYYHDSHTVTLSNGPPPAPVSGAASGIVENSFTANWNAAITATSYRLDVSASSAFTSFVEGYNNLTVTGTSQHVTGLSAGTTYYYRLRAVNSYGTSPNSTVSNTTTWVAAPVATAATAVTATSFIANCSPVTGASSYRLDISTEPDFWPFVDGYFNLLFTPGSTVSTGITPGTTYYYRFRATGTAGTSAHSNTIAVTTIPVTPVANAATNITGTSFTANWSKVSGATSYRLDVSTNSSFTSFVSPYQNYSVTGTSKELTGLKEKTKYYYRVRAANTSGISANSNTAIANLSQNCIETTDVQIEGITTEAQLENASIEQKLVQHVFYDGLGRPIQTVQQQQSPGRLDIVQPTVYDGAGREAVQYLPYTSGNDGWFKFDFEQKEYFSYTTSPQYRFYQETPDVANDPKPFTQTIFEKSPLNRVIKKGAPGTVWQPDATSTYTSQDHTIKYAYETNTTNEVLLWTYTYPTSALKFGMVKPDHAGSLKYYAPGELLKNRKKDEHNREVIEYVNKEGQVVLKRVQAVDGATEVNDENYAATYYVYNDFGKPVCVIPPEATKRMTRSSPSEFFSRTDTERNDFLSRWAFRYEYDARKRLIQKQIPGTAPVYTVYDTRDRVVLTQDGAQRSKREWSFTKYDAFNRPVMTGIYTHPDSISREAMAALISTTAFAEHYDNTKTHGYTTDVFPSTNLTVYTVTYYDNYNFRDDFAGNSYNFTGDHLAGQKATYFNHVKGLVTGTKVFVPATGEYLWSATYYDDKYRVIQTVAQNHKQGTDRVTNICSFTGKVLKTKTTHSLPSKSTDITRTFTYDHAGRLLKTFHQLNDNPEILLSENEYNELGQLITKKLHSEDQGSIFKQYVDYRYNIRGWLTRINNSDLIPDDANEPHDHFGINLVYNDVVSGIENIPQFNGNISAAKWSTGIMDIDNRQAYAYGYDPLNRLSSSAHYKNEPTGWTNDNSNLETGFSYDLNGNILALTRRGTAGETIDALTYGYTGNQLQYVHDTGNADKGFINGNTGTDDYTYDVKGNMVTDKNKNIAAITYNHVNLSDTVLKSSGEYIKYIYDATGRKLSQHVYSANGTLTKKTDYCGEYFYENDTLKFIHHEEGRIIPGLVPGFPDREYQYHHKDHLGNIRLTFTTKNDQESSIATMEDINAENEANEFLYYTEAIKINAALFDHTNNGTTHYSTRLNGTANERTGLAKSISVMPGDTVRAEVYAKYLDTNSGNWTAALNDFVASIANGTAPAGTVIDGGAPGSTGGQTIPFLSLLQKGEEESAAPKAYLNYLIFDRDFVLLNGGYVRMSENAREYGQNAEHEKLAAEFVITKPGYVYIYLSNENETPVEVYFDDLAIAHVKSPVVQVDDYYPFGLTFNSYQRENSLYNKYQFNGKEIQNELVLGWNDYGARMYMSDIGRWGVIDPLSEKGRRWSPYNYALNNPIRFIDPDGMWPGLKEIANGIKNYLVQQAQKVVSNVVTKVKEDTQELLQKSTFYAKGEVSKTNGQRVAGSVTKNVGVDLNQGSKTEYKKTLEYKYTGNDFKSTTMDTKKQEETSTGYSLGAPMGAVGPVVIDGNVSASQETVKENGEVILQASETSTSVTFNGLPTGIHMMNTVTEERGSLSKTFSISPLSGGLSIGIGTVYSFEFSVGWQVEYAKY